MDNECRQVKETLCSLYNLPHHQKPLDSEKIFNQQLIETSRRLTNLAVSTNRLNGIYDLRI